MNKSVLLIIILLFLCIGCSTQKEKAIEKLKPADEYDYNIVVFIDEKAPDYFKESITDEQSIWRNNPNSISFEFIKKGNPDEVDYESIFSVTKYPTIMIFNSEKLAFKTNNVNEMKRFFSKPITFAGHNDHWSVTYTAYIYSRNSEESEYTIDYIGEGSPPKNIDYQIGSTSLESSTNASRVNFPITRPGSGCSGCAITSKDDEIKTTIEWDGKSETFTLTSE